MSANSSTPSPTSGSRLHDEDDENDLTPIDLTEGLDLGFDGAEDLLAAYIGVDDGYRDRVALHRVHRQIQPQVVQQGGGHGRG